MKKLSIIVPVYNVEKYVDRSLDSICKSTWKNLEIYCIDDGSQDRSGVLCDKYACKDARIRVIHQENMGVSAARNVGLKNATGEYIGFVDPDDWVEPNMFQTIIEAMEEHNADIGVCRFFKNWEHREEEMMNQAYVKPVLKRDELLYCAFKAYQHRGVARYLWNKVFKSELFQREGEKLVFDETLHLAEDVLMFGRLMMRAQKTVFVDGAMYHYYQRKQSLFHIGDVDRHKEILHVYDTLMHEMEAGNVDNEIVRLVKRFYVFTASQVLEKAYAQNDMYNVHLMQGEMAKYIADYEATSDGHIEWNEKMRMLMDNPEKVINASFNRFEIGFKVLNKWLSIYQQGKTLKKYFEDHNVKVIAIYGMGMLGERLLSDMNASGVKVQYGIDRAKVNSSRFGITIYSIDELFYPDVDMIIVTVMHEYESILRLLVEKTNALVLSLEDVVDYCL